MGPTWWIGAFGLLGCGRFGFDASPQDARSDGSAACADTATMIATRSDAGPSLARTPDGFAIAWAEAGAVRLAIVTADGIVMKPAVEAGAGDNPVLGASMDGLALVTPVAGANARFVPIDFEGVIGASQELPAIVAPGVRGLPHSGTAWMLGAADAQARMVLQAIPMAPRLVAPEGTWITVAWNGRVLGYSWREGTACYMRPYDGTGFPTGIRRTIATSCFDPEISPRAAGFTISYHTDGIRRPHVISVDDDGFATSSDVDVGPPPADVQYKHVVNAALGEHTYLVFSELGANPAPDWIAAVDANGVAVSKPKAIEAYAVRHDILGLGDRVVIAWRGGTSEATSTASSIYFKLLCP
jgi:hypothetical protein